MHQEFYDFLKLLFRLFATFDVIKRDVNVLWSDFVGAAAHSEEWNLCQRDDDRDDDQN